MAISSAVAGPLAVATVAACLLTAAPARADGTAWPGHPDRRIVSHVVRPGETATGLAVRYHAWTRELVKLNHLGPAAALRAGQRLRIPVVVSAARRARGPRPRPPAAATGWSHADLTRDQVGQAVGRKARRLGVPVRVAQAVAWQESGWRQQVRSPAGAIGVMQVLPSTALWMSLYTHRPLDLLDTRDNITAGVMLLRVLLGETRSTRRAVAAYYQGLGAVRRHGLYPDTKAYVASVLAIRDRL